MRGDFDAHPCLLEPTEILKRKGKDTAAEKCGIESRWTEMIPRRGHRQSMKTSISWGKTTRTDTYRGKVPILKEG